MVFCSPYYRYVCLYVCIYMHVYSRTDTSSMYACVCSRTDTCMYACDHMYVCLCVIGGSTCTMYVLSRGTLAVYSVRC